MVYYPFYFISTFVLFGGAQFTNIGTPEPLVLTSCYR